ncbi:DUF262 domain-containing protein [Cylindrospermopsis raciborskii]|uniref:DUF262 domain-containing protein n=1 Tax=Cylindrospermopsis raciborskii TaxID=77022 RepID=UPI0022C6A112|nr:DUF262 domain-containing protein [Cylindrospermopsis raciborskii]MCZ2202873.1 DUF262 domain-containing protein [Cylindrospermopsis raciborskii PAMP2012]MCZ2207267.1 DUF262 domain-containing protein [Cylindrospermopsis raciborskii PAMP2011]
MVTQSKMTEELRESAEQEIRDKTRYVDYNTLEYPIEVIVQKYLTGKDENENELFIPDYQRELSWDNDRQSKFIESIMLGLPIPYIFVADIRSESEDLARLEIIDGTQRIYTLIRFVTNQLRLQNLRKLEKLNGFIFENLPLSRQRRFNRTTMRIIKLTERADEEVRRDLFERINTGSLELNEMEKRRGIYPGKFLDLVQKLSQNEQFLNLCSFSKTEIDKRDPQEFVLRFFAFLNNYQNYGEFDSKVHKFLDKYLEQENNSAPEEIEKMFHEFSTMLGFVERYLPDSLHVYVKVKKIYKPTTRIKFESITVGVALSLREAPNLIPKSTSFLDGEEFKKLTGSDSSSSQNKVTNRIHYVRDQLLTGIE